jgi:hypothetical protein
MELANVQFRIPRQAIGKNYGIIDEQCSSIKIDLLIQEEKLNPEQHELTEFTKPKKRSSAFGASRSHRVF